jgi:hypothetical protein
MDELEQENVKWTGGVEPASNKRTLELCFISFVLVVVLSAFLIAAFSYDFVAARAPLCVMVPLLVLIGVQMKRTAGAVHTGSLRVELLEAFHRKNKEFNAVAAFIGCMMGLLALILIVGHYVGVAVFMYFLLRVIAKESLRLSAWVTTGVTATIYFLFEHGFNIELYRGLIVRLLSGYS